MGHMLASMNPQAAHEIDNPVALPGVGSTVVYCPRPGEVRAGKTRVPAIVLKADAENGLLDLVVIYEADDFLSRKSLPRRMGEDRGWEPAEGSAQAIAERLDAFKREVGEVLFGEHVKPETSFTDEMLAMTAAIKTLDARLSTLEAKRPVGRPPGPKSPDGAE